MRCWPSWRIELASGLGWTMLMSWVLAMVPVPEWVQDHVPFTLAVGTLSTAGSFVYERWFDPNTFDWSDIGQRSAGIAIGLVLWHYVPVPLLALPL